MADKYALAVIKNLDLGCDSQPCSSVHFLIMHFVLCGFNQLTLIVFIKLEKSCWKITAVPFRLALVTISHKDLAKIACSEYFRPVSISDYFRPAIDDVGLHKICIWPSFWKIPSTLYYFLQVLFFRFLENTQKEGVCTFTNVSVVCSAVPKFSVQTRNSLKFIVCKQCCCSSWMSNAL